MAHKAGYGATGIQGSTLQINVVGCRHLADKEWFSRQDPYVVIEYGSSKLRTRTDTDGGKNPSFNEKFSIPLIEGLREITVQVWNSNTVSLDDFIGSARVLLEKVLSTGYDDTAWALKSKHGKTAGEVNLILHYAKTKKEDKFGAVGHQGAYPSAAGYPPSAFPPAAHGAPAGYPPAHGAPAGYPPAGYPPVHGAAAFPTPAHGGHTGYPPAHGAPSGYAAAPAPGYPPSQPYPAGPSGYPPAGGYPPSAPGYPPPQSSHAAPYPAPGYPPHAPSGHYPAPAGYPSAHAPHAPGPVYGVPPGQFAKHGKVHVGSSGHYKHGKHKKHKKYKGVKFFGKKFKGWKGKGWRGKK